MNGLLRILMSIVYYFIVVFLMFGSQNTNCLNYTIRWRFGKRKFALQKFLLKNKRKESKYKQKKLMMNLQNVYKMVLIYCIVTKWPFQSKHNLQMYGVCQINLYKLITNNFQITKIPTPTPIAEMTVLSQTICIGVSVVYECASVPSSQLAERY